MRYGVTVPNFGGFFDPRTLAAAAHDAEEAGWDGFFLWDHVFFWFLPTADPWVALAAIALSTERVRIGTLVTPLPRRRPLKLARETVSVDHLSGGRLILGVGIGDFVWEWDHLGEEPDKRVRGRMLDEGLEVLTAIWSGAPVAHEGRYYTVHVRDIPEHAGPAPFEPSPVQSPRIPIWVGGFWPNKAPFRRAARWDGVVPIGSGKPLSPDDLREMISYTMRFRASDGPFDVAIGGHTSGTERERDAETVRAYEEAGATWWIESIGPFEFGWQWNGPFPMERMLERIRRGPPGT